MKWTEGHVWVYENLKIDGKNPVFQYKYAVLNNGKPEIWEQGYNRIADLLSLHQVQNQ